MPITAVGTTPPVVTTTAATSAAPATAAAVTPAAVTTAPPSTFTAAAAPSAPVAGLAAEVPAPRAGPLVGEVFAPPGAVSGKIYDAQALLATRVGLSPGGELRLFHHSEAAWATPGEKARISPYKSGGGLGQGFYTSTIPETTYGPAEFQLALPVKAFEGKKIFEVYSGGTIEMPPGVDVLAFRGQQWTDEFWLVFKPGSEDWLNKSTTVADFDKPGEVVGWS